MSNKFMYNLVRNINKQNPKEIAETMVTEINEGEVNVLEVYSALKRMEKIIETTIGDKGDKAIKELALEEVRRYTKDGTTCTVYGANFTASSVHTWYDFSACNDPLWDSLDIAEKKIKALKKARETELKTIPAIEPGKLTRGYRTEVIDFVYSLDACDSGEEATLYAPNKKQREGVKVSIR